MVQEAKRQSKGHNAVIETAIFVAVFLVAEMVFMGAIMIAGIIAIMLLDPASMGSIAASIQAEQASSGDIMAVVTHLTEGTPYMLVSLFAFVGLIGAVFIYVRFIEKRTFSTMGFRKGGIAKEYLVGLVVGAGMFAVAVLLCSVTGTLTFGGVVPNMALGLIGLFFVGFMVQGMGEEVMCRGYFLTSVARTQALPVAVLVSSLVFAALHLLNSGITVLAFVNLALFGVFAGVYMLKRGSIWGIGAVHAAWNFVQGNVFGIAVSGAYQMESVFSFASPEAGALINGGSFGLEGGLAVTVVLAAGVAVLLLMKGKAVDKGVADLGPLQPPTGASAQADAAAGGAAGGVDAVVGGAAE